MSAYLMHSNPAVYESPEKFIPERWIGGNVSSEMLKSFVPFGRGSRNCLGMKSVPLQLLFVDNADPVQTAWRWLS